MEIESQLWDTLRWLTGAWNKENLLKMEIESWTSLWTANTTNFETKKISWKWRLKVENLVLCCSFLVPQKQRKSPENGDWKMSIGVNLSLGVMSRNKENLLKMEIESSSSLHTKALEEDETKKISWKWRLKACSLELITCKDCSETKKISWKWRLKVSGRLAIFPFPQSIYETKKISWKWRLKVVMI